MNLTLNVYEASCTQQPAQDAPATHNVRVHYNESDAGQVSGPFSLSAAQAFAIAAIGKAGVLKASIEEV